MDMYETLKQMLTASNIKCKIPIKILIVQVGLDWPGYIESL